MPRTLQSPAQARGEAVQALVDHVVGMVQVELGHDRVGPPGKLVDDGVEQGDADRDRPRVPGRQRAILGPNDVVVCRKVGHTEEIGALRLGQTLEACVLVHRVLPSYDVTSAPAAMAALSRYVWPKRAAATRHT